MSFRIKKLTKKREACVPMLGTQYECLLEDCSEDACILWVYVKDTTLIRIDTKTCTRHKSLCNTIEENGCYLQDLKSFRNTRDLNIKGVMHDSNSLTRFIERSINGLEPYKKLSFKDKETERLVKHLEAMK